MSVSIGSARMVSVSARGEPLMDVKKRDSQRWQAAGTAAIVETYLTNSARQRQAQADTSSYTAVQQYERDPKFDDVEFYRQAVYDLYDRAIIHPSMINLIRWNAFMLFALACSAYVVPYEIAFTELRVDFHSYIGFAFDVVFVIDTIMQFFIAFETHGYHYCHDHKQIVWHYLITGFTIDAISCLSVSNVFLLRNEYEARLFVVQVLRYTRLLRLARYRRCKSRWTFEMGFSYVTQEVLQNAVTITLACHWMACAWGVSATYDKEKNWVAAVKSEKEVEMPYADITQWSEGPRNYFLALYFGIYLLTGIGLGDIVPVNVCEHAVSMLCMIGGAVCWATVIASIVGIVGQQKEQDMLLQRKFDVINVLARNSGYPEELRRKIREYLTMTRHLVGKQEHEVVNSLSPMLQMAVVMKTHGEWLMKVKYFSRLVNRKTGEGTQFLVDIALAMEVKLYQPGEIIRLAHHLCSVVRGIGFLEGGIAHRNCVWGSDFLMKSMTLRKSFTVLCLTYMQIKVLALDQFQTILSKYPQETRVIQRERVKLIVVRGMVHKAQAELERRAQDPENAGSTTAHRLSQRREQRSFLDFSSQASHRMTHALTVFNELEEEEEDDGKEIVGQANMPEYVSQIKRTQEVFREDVNTRLQAIEASVAQIAEALDRVRTTPWNTA